MMQPQHFAFIILICLIWGFTFVAGKAGVVEFPPFLFTGLRYLLLTLVLLPFLKIHRGQMRNIVLISVTMGWLHFGFFYLGMAFAHNVSVVAVLTQMGAPFATILSILVLGEHVGIRRICALLLAFGGVMVISFDPLIFNDLNGAFFVILAALVGSIGTIIMRQMKNIGTFELQAWIAILSILPLLILSMLFESNQWEVIQTASWRAWSGVLYTALGASLIGHAGMFYLLQRYEVALLSTLTLMAPVFAVIFGILVWGDEIGVRFLIGGSFVFVAALVIIEREGGRRWIGRGV